MTFYEYLNKNRTHYIFIILFLLVPFGASILSSFHMFKILSLGNPWIFAVGLAFIYELGHIGSFLGLFKEKLSKVYIWIIFVILFSMQILGNIYYSYDFVTTMLLDDSNYLSNFSEIIKTIIEWLSDSEFGVNLIRDKMLISCILGIPLPLLSIIFLKILGDYVSNVFKDYTTYIQSNNSNNTSTTSNSTIVTPPISNNNNNNNNNNNIPLINNTNLLSRNELLSPIKLIRNINLPSR